MTLPWNGNCGQDMGQNISKWLPLSQIQRKSEDNTTVILQKNQSQPIRTLQTSLRFIPTTPPYNWEQSKQRDSFIYASGQIHHFRLSLLPNGEDTPHKIWQSLPILTIDHKQALHSNSGSLNFMVQSLCSGNHSLSSPFNIAVIVFIILCHVIGRGFGR